jgi:ribosomal protein S9
MLRSDMSSKDYDELKNDSRRVEKKKSMGNIA